MKKVLFPVLLVAVLTAFSASAEIRGSYVEARNADVWVAQCFANSEVGLAGQLALMAWKVDQGSFNNVPLDGLGVVAVVRASHTLGDPFKSAYPAKAVLIVDQRATMEQRQALKAFAQRMAGDLVQDVVRVEAAPIDFDTAGNLHAGTVRMRAGNYARIETRPLRDGDAVCHNAFAYYPPLSGKLDHAMPARTVDNRFNGEGLNISWSSPDKNSAFLGSFNVESD